MPQEVESELVVNLAHFRTPDAVSFYSFYSLLPEEEYLFSKYYKAGESILDLACGMGRTTLLLFEMGLTVRGVDRSEVFIDICKRRFPYLDLHAGSFDKLEEPDSSFSHVLISFNSIDCAFPESQRIAALRECIRVLKPGGTLIFSSHNARSLLIYSPYYLLRPFWKLRNTLKAFANGEYVYEGGLHLYFASPDFVVRQTEALGMRLLEMNSSAFHRFGIKSADSYFAPYIHYVFTKPS